MIRVLICDDQAIVCEGLQVILESDAAMQVVGIAHDGAEALEKVAALKPDLVLMDLKMPRVDGFEFLEWLRREPGLKIIPVVVFSSSNLPEDVHRAYALGANSFVVKGGDHTSLPETLNTLAVYWLDVCETPLTAMASTAA